MRNSCVSSPSAFSHRDPHSQAKATRGFLCVDFSSINFTMFHPLSFSPSALDGRFNQCHLPDPFCVSGTLGTFSLWGTDFPLLSCGGGGGETLPPDMGWVCVCDEVQLICWLRITPMPGPEAGHMVSCARRTFLHAVPLGRSGHRFAKGSAELKNLAWVSRLTSGQAMGGRGAWRLATSAGLVT